jgi:hypothetical protein
MKITIVGDSWRGRTAATLVALVASWLAWTAPARAEERAQATAVLPFDASGTQLKDLASEVTALLYGYLSAESGLVLVERAELEKILSEQGLGLSGTVAPATAARIGHLTGAKVLVTGRVLTGRNELVLVAKIIGTETGRVYGQTVTHPLRDSHVPAVRDLASKISATITAKAETFVAGAGSRGDRLARLRAQLQGKRLPRVSVRIPEVHVSRAALDPAAETEMSRILHQLGFELVDPATARQAPDIEITGQAFSEGGFRHGQLVATKGRVEVKAIEPATGRVLAVDRQTEVAVDLSELIAGKAALQEAAAAVAERLIPQLVTTQTSKLTGSGKPVESP